MERQTVRQKRREWLRRYIPAESIGTVLALAAAWAAYSQSGSFIAATAAGLLGEGIGFYGYFITVELTMNAKRHAEASWFKRIWLAISAASTNLFVEFALAEVLDAFIVRPYLMYLVPHYVHPYPLGFLAGKFSADALFYALAITGYEARKRWLKR